MKPRVSVIIPYWNGLEKLRQSLPRAVLLEGVSEWILADDASTDKGTDWVKKNFPQVKIVSSPVNSGFPKNVNRGVSRSAGDFVAIINHDLIPSPDAVVIAMENFQDPSVCGVTFKETGEKGRGVCKWQSGWLEIPQPEKSDSQPRQTFWGSGGETIYRRSSWEQLHGYDEIFSPGYWEDVDFGYRSRKRGWKLIWDPRAVVESSQRGQSFNQRWDKDRLVKIKERNRLLLIWKNVISRQMLRDHFVALVKRVAAHPGYSFVLADTLKYLPQIIQKREIERKEATVTDEAVFNQFEKS